MYFFLANLLSIAVMTCSYVYHLQSLWIPNILRITPSPHWCMHQTAASTTEDWPSSGATLYTGSTSPTGSGSGCASKCTSVSTAWLCRPVSNMTVTGICDLLAVSSYRCSQRVRLSTYGGRAFCYAGSSTWNALPDFLKNDALSLSTFRRQLKHFYFSLY